MTDRQTDLGGRRRVGFLEERPDSRSDVLPAAELAVLVRVLETEPLHDVLLGQLVGVEVEPVEDLQRLLRVAVGRVRHPAARLHLVGVQTPEVQLLLEQWPAHVGRVVQLPRPIVVEYLTYDNRTTISAPVEDVTPKIAVKRFSSSSSSSKSFISNTGAMRTSYYPQTAVQTASLRIISKLRLLKIKQNQKYMQSYRHAVPSR